MADMVNSLPLTPADIKYTEEEQKLLQDIIDTDYLISSAVKNRPDQLAQLSPADIKYTAEEQQDLSKIATAVLNANPVNLREPEPEKAEDSVAAYISRVTAAVGHPSFKVNAPHSVAATIAASQMEKNPKEYSKELMMVHQIENDLGFSPENASKAKQAYLTNLYVKQFQGGALPISVLYHPMAKALSPDDYGILRDMFVMMNDEFRQFKEMGTIRRMWNEGEFADRIIDGILSKDIPEADGLKALELIEEISDEENELIPSFFGSMGQYFENILSTDWGPNGKTQIERDLDMYQNKLFSLYEGVRKENPVVGMMATSSWNDTVGLGSIVPALARLNEREIKRVFTTDALRIHVKTGEPVPLILQKQANARAKYSNALVLGNVANAVIGAATGGTTATFGAAVKQYATSQLLGILSGQIQQGTLEAFKTEGRNDATGANESILKAGVKGFFSNILENTATATIFSAPALYQLGRQGYREFTDKHWLEAKDKASSELANLSTADTNPQDTADLIDQSYAAAAAEHKGFALRNADPCVYVDASELKQVLASIPEGLSIFNEDARKVLGDLDNPTRTDGYIQITMGQRAMFFERSPAYKIIRPLMRNSPGGIRMGDLEAGRQTTIEEISRILADLPELSTSNAEIRKEIQRSVHHDISEQLQNDFSRKVADLNLENIDIRGIDEVAKNVSNFMVAIGEVMNLNDADLQKFYKAYMPKFEFIDSELDISSGTTRPKELGNYIPSEEGNVIRLHKNADLITLMHETSHMFLQMVMNAADQVDNAELKAIKNEMYKAFDLDPNVKWADLPFEEQTRVQEVFAYDYLVNRMATSFVSSAEHRENRTLLAHARLNRALGQALLKEKGFDTAKTSNEDKRKQLDEALKQSKADFEASYGFGANIGASKILVDAIDNMTNRSFINHRISTLFPWAQIAPFERFKDLLPPDLYEKLHQIHSLANAEIELSAAQNSINAGRELQSTVVNLGAQLERAIKADPEVKRLKALIKEQEPKYQKLYKKLEDLDKAVLKAKGAVDELADQKKQTKQMKLNEVEQARLDRLLKDSDNPEKTKAQFFKDKMQQLFQAKKNADAKYKEALENRKANANLKDELKALRKEIAENQQLLERSVQEVERRIGAMRADIKRNNEEINKLTDAVTREFDNEESAAYKAWAIEHQQYTELQNHPLSLDMVEGASDETKQKLKELGLLTDEEGDGSALAYWSSFADREGLDLDRYVKSMSEHAATKEQAINKLVQKLYKDSFGKQDKYIDTVVQRAHEIGRKLIGEELKIVTGMLKFKDSQKRLKIAERAAKYLRYAAGDIAYSNTSPNQLAQRAAYHRNNAYEMLINGYKKNGKQQPSDELLLNVYDQLIWAYTFNELSVTAGRVKKDLDKRLDSISRTLNSKNVSRYYDTALLESARAIMNRIGKGNRRDTLINIESIKSIDPDTYKEVKYILDREGFQTNLSSMTLGDVSKVVDLLQSIIHSASETRKLMDEADAKYMASKAQTLSDALKAKIESDPELMARAKDRTERNLADNARTSSKEGRTSRKLNSIQNGTLSMAAWLERVDGSRMGPVKEMLYQKIADAENVYKDLSRKFAEKLKPTADLMRRLDEEDKFKNMKVEFVTVGENAKAKKWVIKSGKDGSIQKQLMAILVNTGTDSNLEAMARSMDVSPDTIVLKLKDLTNDGVITKEMWDAAQNIWDTYREIGKLTMNAHYEMTGKIYKQIPARKIKTAYGEYTGGYVPVHSIRSEHIKSIDDALQDFNSNLPPKGDGFTRDRVKTNNEIDLTVPAIFDSIEKQLRYATLLPEITKADKLARSSSKMVADLETVREGFFDEIYTPWLVSVANQTNTNVRDLQGLSLLNNMAAVLNASVLSMNVVNAMQQYTGLIVAALRVNKGALFHAIVNRKRVNDVAQASVFMRNRFHMEQVSLGKLQRDIMTKGKLARARNFMMDHAYFLQSMIQRHVDTIVWTAKYNEVAQRLYKEGKTDTKLIDRQAIKEADDAVRATQGSFNTSDSSAIERSPVVKALLPFTNYFITMGNLVSSELDIRNRAARNKFEKIWNAGVVGMFALILPSVVGTLMVQALKGEYYGDEETSDLMLEAGVKAPLMTTLTALNPVAGVVGTSAWDIFSGKSTNNSLLSTPVATFVPQAMNSIHHLYQSAVDDRDLSPNDWGNVARVAALYSPQFPNFAKQAGVAAALSSGDYDTSDWSDNIRAIVTGKLSPAQKGEQ